MNRFRATLLVTSTFLLVLLPPPCANAAPLAACDEASLRAAIAQGGEIQFNCDGTIVLTSTLVITNDVTLDATGHTVTLSGGGGVRVLKVAADASATLRHVTITQGRSSQGAGIFNQGRLRLDRCVLTANQAIGQTGTNGLPGPSPGLSGGPGEMGGSATGAALHNTGLCTAEWTTFSSNDAVG